MINIENTTAVSDSDSTKIVKVAIKGTMVDRPNKGIVVNSRIRAGSSVNPWKVP